MKRKSMVGITAVALGAVLALIPVVIFPVCTDMIKLQNGKTIFMRCHWTAIAELFVGILIVFNGILIVGLKKNKTKIALSILLFLFGVTALLIPTVVIGMCDTASMPCRVGTLPALITVSLITMLVGTGNVISLCSSIKREGRAIKKWQNNDGSIQKSI